MKFMSVSNAIGTPIVPSGLVFDYAREGNATALLIFLQENEVDLKSADTLGNRAVDYASRFHSSEMLEMLIDREVISPSVTPSWLAPNRKGFFPIHVAAASGSVECTRLLLDRGACANQRTANQQATPLYFARKREVAQLLLERGADPMIQVAGKNCLQLRMEENNWMTFWFLISHHPQLALQEDAERLTVAHRACLHSSTMYISLIRVYCNISLQWTNSQGKKLTDVEMTSQRCAQLHALYEKSEAEIAQLLLEFVSSQFSLQ